MSTTVAIIPVEQVEQRILLVRGLVALADLCLELPMMGVKQSLNVATAFGVLGYELARRHRKSS